MLWFITLILIHRYRHWFLPVHHSWNMGFWKKIRPFRHHDSKIINDILDSISTVEGSWSQVSNEKNKYFFYFVSIILQPEKTPFVCEPYNPSPQLGRLSLKRFTFFIISTYFWRRDKLGDTFSLSNIFQDQNFLYLHSDA